MSSFSVVQQNQNHTTKQHWLAQSCTVKDRILELGAKSSYVILVSTGSFDIQMMNNLSAIVSCRETPLKSYHLLIWRGGFSTKLINPHIYLGKRQFSDVESGNAIKLKQNGKHGGGGVDVIHLMDNLSTVNPISPGGQLLLPPPPSGDFP